MASRGPKAPSELTLGTGRFSTSTWLITLVVIFSGIGLVMVGSASSVISMSYYGSPWTIFGKDVLWTVLGLLVLALCAKVDYHYWRRWTKVFLGISFLGLLAASAFGSAAGGASRWIGYGQIKFQPSEMMKLSLLLYGADLLTKKTGERLPAKQVAAPFVLVSLLASVLVIIQPDLGTGLVLIVISAAMLYTVGIPRKMLVQGFLAVAALVGLASVMLPYRRARLMSFMDPGAHSDGSGYQVVQSLIGLGSGNISGLGLGNSREKWGLLPNAHTDFIFSVIGEELGLIGILAVLVLVGILAMKGFRAVDESRDLYGALVASGITTWIIAEALVNMGAALGVLPVTGIPLPFVSFGGTSLLVTMAAAGILVNVARQGGKPKRRKPGAQKPSGAARRPTSRPASRPRSAATR